MNLVKFCFCLFDYQLIFIKTESIIEIKFTQLSTKSFCFRFIKDKLVAQFRSLDKIQKKSPTKFNYLKFWFAAFVSSYKKSTHDFAIGTNKKFAEISGAYGELIGGNLASSSVKYTFVVNYTYAKMLMCACVAFITIGLKQ